MAYYTGAANSFAELRDALVSMCTTNGWSWNSGTEVLSKAGLFSKSLYVYLGYTATALRAHGKSTLVEGWAPNAVGIATNTYFPITFPVTYYGFVFTNPDEVFFVINCNIDFYQFVSFGQSDRWGLPGTGLWTAGTHNNQSTGQYASAVSIGVNYGGSGQNFTSAAIFWDPNGSTAPSRNYSLHADLDAQGWWQNTNNGTSTNSIGITDIGTLLGQLPNSWNSEAGTQPIRCYKNRPEGFVSITAELANARYTRNDYYQPRQIINIGTERWMVFPFYKKDASARNGGPGVYHSGTFAWAVRYDGP